MLKSLKKCNRLLVLDKMFYHYRKPRHETLVSKYVSDFYELCKLKYTKERDLLTRYGIPDEKDKGNACDYSYETHFINVYERMFS